MKLTYWHAPCLSDSACYSIRERTKKAALEQRDSRGAERFGPVTKVVVEYDDGFDLLELCLSEGGVPQEPRW